MENPVPYVPNLHKQHKKRRFPKSGNGDVLFFTYSVFYGIIDSKNLANFFMKGLII